MNNNCTSASISGRMGGGFGVIQHSRVDRRHHEIGSPVRPWIRIQVGRLRFVPCGSRLRSRLLALLEVALRGAALDDVSDGRLVVEDLHHLAASVGDALRDESAALHASLQYTAKDHKTDSLVPYGLPVGAWGYLNQFADAFDLGRLLRVHLHAGQHFRQFAVHLTLQLRLQKTRKHGAVPVSKSVQPN